ncbi:MAG: peptidylprolyl isomerase [Candidatus Solibacter sp.]
MRIICVLMAVALAGCSSSDEGKKGEAPQAAPKAPEKTPDVFQAVLDTSKGQVVVEVHRDWAPAGVDHLYSLMTTGFYDNARFFRVTHSYVQFGIAADPQTNGLWSTARIKDDPPKQSNVKGTLTYAHLGPGTRTTQLFFNVKNNKDLDKQGFAPLGKVISGMDVVEGLYGAYGDVPPRGMGPDTAKIEQQGNVYLDAKFPRLDFIKKITIQ